MTDEQWEELRPLAEAEAEARAKLEAIQMINLSTDPRARIEVQAIHERANNEWIRAYLALSDARKRVLGS